MAIDLAPHQLKALKELHNGAILRGGVGSGKSRTAAAYYVTEVCNGRIQLFSGVYPEIGEGNGASPGEEFQSPKDLYIITTAKKRDDLDWEAECLPFGVTSDRALSISGVLLTTDSWNNITNYADVEGAFFIFDEQRLVGSGAWVKAFLKIAKKNDWIMLSATPGDAWVEFAPVFIANGFFKNRTEFLREHVVYSRHSRYPKIDRYIGTGRLNFYRSRILVEMPFQRHTNRHIQSILCNYDRAFIERLVKDRWNPYTNEPLRDFSELLRVMRKSVNSDSSRIEALKSLLQKHPSMIIFYNFNYELELLRTLGSQLGIAVAEWNGHKHQTIPEGSSWMYLVQYTAGAEGWNCVTTNAMAFWSQNYSWKIFEQTQGRIDRLNTPFKDLFYYVFTSDSYIDKAISKALATKHDFNEKKFEKEMKW